MPQLADAILERDGCVVLTGITTEETRSELLHELQAHDGDENIAIVCVPCHMAKTSAEQSARRRTAPSAPDGE